MGKFAYLNIVPSECATPGNGRSVARIDGIVALMMDVGSVLGQALQSRVESSHPLCLGRKTVGTEL